VDRKRLQQQGGTLKRFFISLLVALISACLAYIAFFQIFGPDVPDIENKQINVAIDTMERSGFTLLYSHEVDFPISDCSAYPKSVFLLHTADAWHVVTEQNKDCVVVDVDVVWVGPAL